MARELGNVIGIVPAGERWPDGSLRPSIEDLLGAGALIEHLIGSMSPEAQTAQDAFRAARHRLEERLMHSVSGTELIERGYTRDVHLASQLNVSQCVPRLQGGAYINERDFGSKA
jgi:2-phosphosulfolactate phosphatase